MDVGVLPACMPVFGVCSALEGQKRALDPLKLELQVIVSHHMGAGNQAWLL